MCIYISRKVNWIEIEEYSEILSTFSNDVYHIFIKDTWSAGNIQYFLSLNIQDSTQPNNIIITFLNFMKLQAKNSI